ncbi:MAG: hypothetical protein PHC46_00005 [Clostridia bacterium]|nr:hypothetical protein [Clostridia bacterium]
MSKYDKILIILTVWLIILATLVRLNLIAFIISFFVGGTISLILFLSKKEFFKKQIKSDRLKNKTI